MKPQVKLLLNLSMATPVKDDTKEFYHKKVIGILQALKEGGHKDFNFRSLLGDTLVHICTYNRLPNILESIYEYCKENQIELDLTLCDGKVGQTPIAIAATMGNVDLVKWFIKKANESTSSNDVYRTLIKRTDTSQKPPVFFAAAYGGKESIRNELLQLLDPLGGLINATDLNGISAQNVLFKRGFSYPGTEESPALRDCFGRTEFMIDLFSRNTENIKAKLAACATPLERAQLVNAKDYCGRSALIYACYMGFKDIIDLFIENADVNQPDNMGQVPLHFAVLFAYKLSDDPSQIVQKLLEHNAQDMENHYGLTPSDFAMTIESELSQKIIRGAQIKTEVLKAPNSTLTQQFKSLSVILDEIPTVTSTTTSPVQGDVTVHTTEKSPRLGLIP